MQISDYTPTALLRPFVKTYRIIESHNEVVNRLLPTTSLAMAFRFKGYTGYLADAKRNDLPVSTFSGLRKSVRLINYDPNTSTIVVLFKAIGASAFFNEPLHELFEQSVSLDNFISHNKVAILEEQLVGAKNNIQRISIVEQFLLAKLYNHQADKLILNAVERIQLTKGFLKIKKLADTLCISNDAFEKRFRNSVGTSPKRFASIVRMSSVVSQKQQKQNLANLAFDAGYYDQSHFNKDFKLFTGQSPTDFFKSPSFW